MPDELPTTDLNAQSVSVLLVRNPFDPARSAEHRTLEHHPSWSVAEYLTILAPADEYVVSVNGGPVKIEERPDTFLEPGDQLVVVPLVAGGEGGGGKMAARIVGMIVVAILTWYVSYLTVPAMLAAGFSEGAAYGAGIAASMAVSIGGSMLVNTLTQLPPPRLPDVSGMGDTSATYGWDGPKTLAMQGIPIPIVYGVHRLPPELLP